MTIKRLVASSGYAALAVLMLGAVSPADAAVSEGPWCAIIPTGEGSISERCDMRSFEMCRAEIQGVGGSCRENPYYYAAVSRERAQPSRRRPSRD